MQNLTPNSNLNLKAEIAFFEALEQYTHLSLGELTKLRKKSRVEKKNLLQQCLDDQLISSDIAMTILQRLKASFPDEQLLLNQQTEAYLNSRQPTPSPTSHPADDFLAQDQVPYSQTITAQSNHLNVPIIPNPYQQAFISQQAPTPKQPPLQNLSALSTRSSISPLSITASITTAQAMVSPLNTTKASALSLPPLVNSTIEANPSTPSPLLRKVPSPIPAKPNAGALAEHAPVQSRTLEDDSKPISMSMISSDDSSDQVVDIAQDTLELEDEAFEKADFVYLPIKIEDDFFHDLDQKLHIFEVKNICLQRKYESIVLDEQASALELKAFKRGYFCLSLFDKPYFPKIYDFALTSDQKYMVNLQSIEGVSLVEQLKTKEMSWLKRGVYLWQLCYLMAQIHKQRMLFLNLNPKMIEVCSFGLRLRAWQLSCPIDMLPEEIPLSLVHDPDFCAPELFKEQMLGFENDVYSLGAVVFWLYTQQVPPKEEALIPLLLDKVKDMPAVIKKACIKALSQQPQARQSNAILFYEDCFANALPVFQRNDSMRYTAFTSDHALSLHAKELEHLAIHYEAGIFPSIYEPLSQHLPWMNLFTLGIAPEAELRVDLEKWQDLTIRKCAPTTSENQRLLAATSLWEEGIYELSWGIAKEHHLQLLLKANDRIILQEPVTEAIFEHACPLRKGLICIGSIQPRARELSLHFIDIPACAPKISKCSKQDYLLFLNQQALSDRYMRLPLNWQIQGETVLMEGNPQELLTGISFLDAQAYCLWYSKVNQSHYELLSEGVWERLARGAGCEEWIGSGEYDLLDLEEQQAELIFHSLEWALLKGGKLSKGRVAWRQLVNISEKLSQVGFRIALML